MLIFLIHLMSVETDLYIGFVCYIGKAYVFMYVLKLSLNIIIPKYGYKVEKNNILTKYISKYLYGKYLIKILPYSDSNNPMRP